MPRLMANIDDLHQVSARFLFATWQELEWQSRSDDEHRVILARLRARNMEGAISALETHILAAGRALCTLLATAQQPAPKPGAR
jgi:DNA-binding GntR family transcriptional regulator